MPATTTDGERAAADLERLRDDLRALRDDVSSLARDRAAGLRDTVTNGAKAAQERTADAVRENPVTTLAIAAGAGALLGIIASRCGGR